LKTAATLVSKRNGIPIVYSIYIAELDHAAYTSRPVL